MKFLKFIFLLIFGITLKVYSQNNNKDSIIFWSKDNKLNWDQFKGVPLKSSDYKVAWSYVQIYTKGYWEEYTPNYKVYVVFKKYDSWSKDTTMATLKHEQVHFDIGEVFARKMRKAIFELREENIDSIDQYLQILNKYFEECKQMNYLYDKETAHGVYKRKQEEWNKKIARELCELKNYEVDYTEYLDK